MIVPQVERQTRRSGRLNGLRCSGTPIGVEELQVSVTVSLGGVNRDGESSDGLILRADAALYAAKERGRDRVVISAARDGDRA